MSYVASPAREMRAPVEPGPWIPDEKAPKCARCRIEFGLVTRRHHCRGCGKVYCSNCTTTAKLYQYGFVKEPVTACLICVAPYVLKANEVPTSGGMTTLLVFNVDDSVKDVKVELDETELALAEDALTPSSEYKFGYQLQVTMPPGVGLHNLTVTSRTKGHSGLHTLPYASPVISRTSALATKGGEFIIFGTNFGVDAAAVQVTLDGVPATDVSIKSSHKKIRCVVGPGSGKRQLCIDVGEQYATFEVKHEEPVIESVEPDDADIIGGPLAVNGHNFGVDASKIEIVLADFTVQCTQVAITIDHKRVEFRVPTMPTHAEAGVPIAISIIVDGIRCRNSAYFVYSPPGGVLPTSTRPGYRPRRSLLPGANTAAALAATPKKAVERQLHSPYENLFIADLPKEASTSPTNDLTEGSTPIKFKGRSLPVRVIGGTIGDGPQLTVTSPKHWIPDGKQCELCEADFTLLNRRHHCRVCGSCICHACSPVFLEISDGRGAVRICSRCNTRVSLLQSMTKVISSIYDIRKTLPDYMFSTFKHEVVEAVLGPMPTLISETVAKTPFTTPSKPTVIVDSTSQSDPSDSSSGLVMLHQAEAREATEILQTPSAMDVENVAPATT